MISLLDKRILDCIIDGLFIKKLLPGSDFTAPTLVFNCCIFMISNGHEYDEELIKCAQDILKGQVEITYKHTKAHTETIVDSTRVRMRILPEADRDLLVGILHMYGFWN